MLSIVPGLAASKTIAKPMFNGNRLDWCMKWSEDCGRPVADAWCRAQGFVKALQFTPDRHIGARTPTRLIGTGATCDLAHCDGFRQITCLKQTVVAEKASRRARASATPTIVIKRAAGVRLASAGPVIIAPPLPTPRPTFISTSPRGASLRIVGADARLSDIKEDKANAVPASADANNNESAVSTGAPSPQPAPAQLASAAAVDAPKPTPAARIFEKPMYNGKRLAWCHQFDAECGKPAAEAFCKANGFTTASEFTVDPHIGDLQPTRSIGSGAVCDQAPCDGFKVIACSE